ncbi:MAG: hypothetical protein V1724_08940 [Chloroflexota bacterium]
MKRPGAKSSVNEGAAEWDQIQKGPAWQKKVKALRESIPGMRLPDGLIKWWFGSMEDRARLLVIVNLRLTELRGSSPVEPNKGEKVSSPFIGEKATPADWLDSPGGKACVHVLPTIWHTTFLEKPDEIYLAALFQLASAQFNPFSHLENQQSPLDSLQKDMSILWFYYTYLASSAPPEFTVLVDGACMHLVYYATCYIHANIKLITKHNQIIPRAAGKRADARKLVEWAVKEIGEETLRGMKRYPRAELIKRVVAEKKNYEALAVKTILGHLKDIVPTL